MNSKITMREDSKEMKNHLKISYLKHTGKIPPPDSETSNKSSQDIDVHPLNMIRRWEFQIIWIAYFCLLYCVNTYTTLWKVVKRFLFPVKNLYIYSEMYTERIFCYVTTLFLNQLIGQAHLCQFQPVHIQMI